MASRPSVSRRQQPGLGPLGVVIVAVLVVTGVAATLSSGAVADTFGSLGVLIGMSAAGITIFVKAGRIPQAERAGFRVMGLAMAFGVSGVVVVAVLSSVREIPAFGWADLFFFMAYVLMILGFALLPHTWGTSLHRTRIVLDGLIGAVSIGALMWVFVLSDVLQELEAAPPWEQILAATYPFLDLAMLVVAMLIIMRRSSYRFDLRLGLLAIALIFMMLADLSFLASGVGQSFEDARPVYAFFAVAVTCFYLMSYWLERTPQNREYAERAAPLWTLLLPYGAALAMVGVLVVHIVSGASDGEELLFIATLIIGGLVIVRQAVAIRENRTIVEQQRNSLVSSISHELRTPLTSIVGFTELLTMDDGIAAQDRREMTGIVHQQVIYMSRIVADLVMLARGNPDEIRLEISEVDVAALIETSIHGSGVDRSSVTVECEPGFFAIVDADRIQQVLVNLLTNAARYGGPHRAVVARSNAADVYFEVHDDGPGVPRRHELTIWERFERGPNRLNATVPGSGIGLAIVEAISRAHGGTAHYWRSERMGGACFEVALPGRGIHRMETPAARTPASSDRTRSPR